MLSSKRFHTVPDQSISPPRSGSRRRRSVFDEVEASPHHHDEAMLGSFLVRLWSEPRCGGEGAPVVRGYVRDLRTGAEVYISDPAKIGSQIAQWLPGPLAGELPPEGAST